MNGVDIIDKSYLERKCRLPEWNETVSGIVSDFHLNHEQDRAFCIVANHVYQARFGSDQLKMYIGGMAGTGKSQVLKAVIRLFELRNECHRFIVVAPMGSAAALLGRSTYHSVFGINDRDTSQGWLAQVRAQLMGVKYIFFDEVSMLSCCDMFRLNLQMI